jgi:hypothetical protein
VQSIDCTVDFFDGESTFRRFKTGILRQIQVIQVLRLVNNGLAANGFAVVIDKQVPHDSEHPPLEIDIVDVFLFVVQRFQNSVLKQIVRIVTISG